MLNDDNQSPGGSRFHPGRPREKGTRLERTVLTSEEVSRLMDHMNNGVTGDRLRAIVAVMYSSGLRIAEAMDLVPSDVNVKDRLITVRNGKGGKKRTVAIDDGGLRYVEKWLAHRKGLGISAKAPLFCKLDGSPWSDKTVRAGLRGAARRARIEKRVHPHAFRHSHAFGLAMSRVPPNVIQKSLGHANLATTQVYLSHVAPEDIVRAVDSVDWWGTKDAPPAADTEPAA